MVLDEPHRQLIRTRQAHRRLTVGDPEGRRHEAGAHRRHRRSPVALGPLDGAEEALGGSTALGRGGPRHPRAKHAGSSPSRPTCCPRSRPSDEFPNLKPVQVRAVAVVRVGRRRAPPPGAGAALARRGAGLPGAPSPRARSAPRRAGPHASCFPPSFEVRFLELPQVRTGNSAAPAERTVTAPSYAERAVERGVRPSVGRPSSVILRGLQRARLRVLRAGKDGSGEGRGGR